MTWPKPTDGVAIQLIKDEVPGADAEKERSTRLKSYLEVELIRLKG